MRDPARITPMLAMLAEVWRDYPDQRLGQLVMNLSGEDGRVDGGTVFNVEDDKMFDRLREVMENGF